VLDAAPSLADVPATPPERCHPLKGDRDGEFAVDVQQPHRLVFRPNHEPVPRKDDGGIDLRQVTEIEVLSIEDYH
jgi:proteic killer suppression protein